MDKELFEAIFVVTGLLGGAFYIIDLLSKLIASLVSVILSKKKIKEMGKEIEKLQKEEKLAEEDQKARRVTLKLTKKEQAFLLAQMSKQRDIQILSNICLKHGLDPKSWATVELNWVDIQSGKLNVLVENKKLVKKAKGVIKN